MQLKSTWRSFWVEAIWKRKKKTKLLCAIARSGSWAWGQKNLGRRCNTCGVWILCVYLPNIKHHLRLHVQASTVRHVTITYACICVCVCWYFVTIDEHDKWKFSVVLEFWLPSECVCAKTGKLMPKASLNAKCVSESATWCHHWSNLNLISKTLRLPCS